MNEKQGKTDCGQREDVCSSERQASSSSANDAASGLKSSGADDLPVSNTESAVKDKNPQASVPAVNATPTVWDKEQKLEPGEGMNISRENPPEPEQETGIGNSFPGQSESQIVQPAESATENALAEKPKTAEPEKSSGELSVNDTKSPPEPAAVIDPAIYGLEQNAVLTDTLTTDPVLQQKTATDPVLPGNNPERPVFKAADFYKVTTFFPVKPRTACPIEELTEWMQSNDIQFGLNYVFGGERRYISAESSEKIWFIADLHGDYYSFRKIIDHIDMTDPEASIVFMGDIFDRGKNLETVKAILELIKNRPGKIVWLAGNHDTALYYSEEICKFSSRVSGHDAFYEELNRLKGESPACEAFGKALIGFIAKLPHAILFADGIIVSHGGIPLQDTLENIMTVDDFNSDAARYDFIWARPEDKEQKPPSNPAYINTEKDRTSTAWYKQQRLNPDPSGPAMFKSCWTAFAEKLQDIAKIKPYCMLVGHQHPGKGFDLAGKQYPCIFLNSNLKTGGSGINTRIAFARGRKNGTPEVIVLTLDRADYDSFYEKSLAGDDKK